MLQSSCVQRSTVPGDAVVKYTNVSSTAIDDSAAAVLRFVGATHPLVAHFSSRDSSGWIQKIASLDAASIVLLSPARVSPTPRSSLGALQPTRTRRSHVEMLSVSVAEYTKS